MNAKLKNIMTRAHAIARATVLAHGGKHNEYMSLALSQAWGETKVKAVKTAIQIAESLNASGYKYYGERAKGWISNDGAAQRVYFGSDYVTIEDGRAHNARYGKARAATIGISAVQAVESVM